MRDLDGQRLVGVDSGSLPNSWKFEFDLGGALELWPSTEYETTDNLWSLYRWSDDPEQSCFVAAMKGDGALVFK